MKNLFKRFGVFLIACIMVMGLSVTAFASGSNHYLYTRSNTLSTNSSSWKTIATSDNGFDCKVRIIVTNNNSNTYTSVRMLGKSGNTLWEKTNAISGSGSADFDCGSDVYTIQVKTVSGAGTAWIKYVSEL